MKKTFLTKEQSEKANNRLVLNFGILLAGALVLLYVFNFAQAGYPVQVKNVLGVLGIVFLVLAVAMLILGFKKWSKLKTYSAIPFAAIVPCALVSYFHKIPFLTNAFPGFTIKNAIIVTLILMAVYFVVLAVYTGIYSATHPVLVEKKKIQHKKKK
ncbi:MAG: hypothetical protein IJB50_03315 [Clostridia bacterium]|nr:hypothetical protein [Clostridia bacterium]